MTTKGSHVSYESLGRDAIVRIQQLRRTGKTVRAIAAEIGCALSYVHKALQGETPTPPVARRKKAKRACLCCRETFMSEGPHNRLCDRCRRQRLTAFDFSPV